VASVAEVEAAIDAAIDAAPLHAEAHQTLAVEGSGPDPVPSERAAAR
jgi:hypothetical protein